MPDLISNLRTASSDAHATSRSIHAMQANTEKLQEQIKLPFALYSETAQHELKKRELHRKESQVKEVNKNSSGSMSMVKYLPLNLPKIKRRLRAVEKAYEKLFKRLGKLFKKNQLK